MKVSNYLKNLFLLNIFLLILVACSDSSLSGSNKMGTKNSFDFFKHDADPGPFIGGGGGEVIVCFGSKETRDQSFDQKGSLLDSARDQILQIYSYDIVDQKFSNYLPAFPNDKESPVDFLNRHTEDIFHIAPYFAIKLRQSIDLVLNGNKDTSAWVNVGAIPEIGDSGKRWYNKDNPSFNRINLFCRPFQIAKRIEIYEKNNRFPIVKIQYDADLFNRLKWMNEVSFPGIGLRKNAGVYNQAVLILHEALYLMTSSLGATESLSARELLPQVLFDFKSYEKLLMSKFDKTPKEIKRYWYNNLTRSLKAFGLMDYPRLFLGDQNSKALPKTLGESYAASDAQLLAESYAHLNDLINKWILINLDKSNTSSPKIKFLSHDYYSDQEADFLLSKVTDIEAFIYASEIIWQTEPKDYFHFEFLFILNDPEDFKTMKMYFCRQIEVYLNSLSKNKKVKNLYKMFNRANNFCETSTNLQSVTK